MNKRYLTAFETAQMLGISTGALANMRYRGRGPRFIRYRRRIRYDIDDIEAWMDQHKVNTSDYMPNGSKGYQI